jgi:branched-subunit amino acid aminotransferase/4-amino-4-deoxychorismate lyase
MPKTLCFDLDGTLCTNTFGDYESAEPFEWAIARVNALARDGNRILIVTARGFVTKRDWSDQTRAQLERWGVEYDELVFGKPSADVYVDDRAVHCDAWRTGDGFDPPGFTTVFDSRCKPVRAATVLPAVVPSAVSCLVENGRTFAGRPLRLREHVGRLLALAAAAGLRTAIDPEELTRCARTTLLDWGHDPGGDVAYALTLTDAPAVAQLDLTTDGRDVVFAVSRRALPEVARALLPHVVHDGGELRVRAELHEPDAPTRAWPLLRAGDGTVTDALGGQLAVVRNGALRVAPTAGRPSVVSGWVRALAGALGAPFEVAPISESDLAEADELMIAGTPFCILPVAAIDGAAVADGAIGGLTNRLLDAWSAEVGLDLAAQTTELVRRSAQTAVTVP